MQILQRSSYPHCGCALLPIPPHLHRRRFLSCQDSRVIVSVKDDTWTVSKKITLEWSFWSSRILSQVSCSGDANFFERQLCLLQHLFSSNCLRSENLTSFFFVPEIKLVSYSKVHIVHIPHKCECLHHCQMFVKKLIVESLKYRCHIAALARMN